MALDLSAQCVHVGVRIGWQNVLYHHQYYKLCECHNVIDEILASESLNVIPISNLVEPCSETHNGAATVRQRTQVDPYVAAVVPITACHTVPGCLYRITFCSFSTYGSGAGLLAPF